MFALFDSNLPGAAGAGAWLLSQCSDEIRCSAQDDWRAALNRLEQAARNGAWVALALDYELGHVLERKLAGRLPAEGVLLRGWIFAQGEWLDEAACDAWLAARAGQGPHGCSAFTPAIAREDYLSRIERIRAYIAAGDCYQVNFTFPLLGHSYGNAAGLYRQLRAAQPVRYGAYIEHAEGAILSRSPELFLEREGDTLASLPMKGTAPRHTDPDALATSAKNRAENVMIVDLIRNDMGRLVPPGGVRVSQLCQVEGYSTVWQMISRVEASPVRASLAEIMEALFPCGSITGAPKIRAMEIIHELETRQTGPRGRYCGALGWIRPGGDFRFSVPIRTLLRAPDGAVKLQVGSGVVHDSVAADEWDECLLKGQFATRLPQDLRLIETLAYRPDLPEPLPRLALHLARLSDSARWLGFTFDPASARQLLAGVTGEAPLRLRLTLDQHGALQLEQFAFTQGAPGADPSVVLSPIAMDSRNPLLAHKTTARAVYDAELTRVMGAGHFDALFVNERGELTEGARSNLFLEIDGELLTPPLASGVLPGVLRRSLLDSGQAREAVLYPSDLHRAGATWVGNSLRGMISVRFINS
ncbi:MAG: chorismate-binding protein [Zoogloea sp.]|uniref:bifunctional chorismate-binding protein/class IV aminotransferase n=1 Tax=Zoogloea sp. TaxID=49181 RepID=UPI003F2EA2CD